MPPFHNPQDCGWPRLYAKNATSGAESVLNATARLVDGGRALELSAALPHGLEVVATSYGRASWPMTVFFSEGGVPVLPWYATLDQTLPWVLPASVADDAVGAEGGASAPPLWGGRGDASVSRDGNVELGAVWA